MTELFKDKNTLNKNIQRVGRVVCDEYVWYVSGSVHVQPTIE